MSPQVLTNPNYMTRRKQNLCSVSRLRSTSLQFIRDNHEPVPYDDAKNPRGQTENRQRGTNITAPCPQTHATTFILSPGALIDVQNWPELTR